MRTIELGTSGMRVPTVGVGCMRLAGLSATEAERFVGTALELGANFFDHADIYGGGACEERFAEALRASGASRDQVILQSKCGIRPGVCYDLSHDHIVSAVDGILERLQTDYLDVLLLHRPDALVEPEEVAAAFDELEAAGKVRHFGVSNMGPYQIQLLQTCVRQPLVADQLQMSPTNSTAIGAGMHVNMLCDEAIDRDGGALDFCRINKITVQCWSPFQYGTFEGCYLGSEKYPELNAKLGELAAVHGVTPATIAIAWLLRHPAHMLPVVGTTNAGRLAECVRAADVTLTREEWYEVYLAAGNTLP